MTDDERQVARTRVCGAMSPADDDAPESEQLRQELAYQTASARDAEGEIERLTVELAAVRESRDQYKSNWDRCREHNGKALDTIAALRTELSEARGVQPVTASTPHPEDPAMAVVKEFCRERGQYVTAINNCHPDNHADYYRWQGHAEARRQLTERLEAARVAALRSSVAAQTVDSLPGMREQADLTGSETDQTEETH